MADLYLHANMQPHADLFDLTHVNVIRHGDVAIQDLLLRSMAVVTDYTSAAIDFSFLDRPVFYYQFDRTRFLGRRPSHFDLDEELPGEIVGDAPELIGALEARGRARLHHPPGRAREGVAPRRAPRHRRPRADRPGGPARPAPTPRPPAAPRRHPVGAAPVAPGQARRAVVALRESMRGPLQTALYRVARRLPRNGAVVFESNLGADFGDSPGAIHRALTRAGAPGAHGLGDAAPACPAAGAAGRSSASRGPTCGSMGRASVWVTNQNMPAWMRRPAGTYYLQTWHGTPLKRMLHDLDTVSAATPGYVERVDRMISEWSLLLSRARGRPQRFRSAFRYDGDLLEAGYPRNDALADGRPPARAERVRKRLGLARSKKVLVYAPTFRDDQRDGKRFTFVLPIDLALLVGGGRGGVRDRRPPPPDHPRQGPAAVGGAQRGGRLRDGGPARRRPTCSSPTTPR